MNIMYFSSHEAMQEFAHGEDHRSAWKWWNETLKKNGHLSISHGVYSVPRGKWETVYVNFARIGLGEWFFGRPGI